MVTKQEKQCMVCPKSPIRSHGGFCLQPESADCSPADNTRLVYMKDTPQCSKDYMLFTYYNDVLTHKCSGKKVCPQGGTVTSQTPLVISSTCQLDASKFQRTLYTTLKHKASGFCVHPISGTPKNGAAAIMWKDDCNEERLKLDLFKLKVSRAAVFNSPIQAYNGFCLQPESANCNPADGTRLIYHKLAQCNKNYMYFTYKDKVLVHTCSGKKVCPQGGTASWGTLLVVSSTCPSDASKFQRTSHKTLKHKASGFCVHPYGGPPKEGIHAVMWKDACSEDRLQIGSLHAEGLVDVV
ncbi:metalloendopeptidase [Desmophyllum pertusum]|uniref:Metalloendopeptidase n=1 Tax=Desmophyllum pertusum TaxID=174260 RepID=A0A9X0DCH6_9CNID|nr:metalloendopeptidase [Desmophyllum pertusum]